jgi:hypothetical protein
MFFVFCFLFFDSYYFVSSNGLAYAVFPEDGVAPNGFVYTVLSSKGLLYAAEGDAKGLVNTGVGDAKTFAGIAGVAVTKIGGAEVTGGVIAGLSVMG